MNRQILCRDCGERLISKPMHPEDRAQGWKRRALYISTTVPKGHGIRVNGKFSPMADLHCDHCNKVVTGEIAVAITMWREGEPFPNWETQYGTLVPEPAVKMHDVLVATKRKPNEQSS